MSSSQSSNSSSGASKGSEWKNKLYFIEDAVNSETSITEVTDDNLKSYFAKINGTDEEILKVEMYKSKLHSLAPKWFGLWHEFTLVKSKNFFWSFEKNSEGICVQRGKTLESVKNYCFGNKRDGIEPEGRDSQNGKKGDKVQDIFIWIYEQDYLNQGYHATQSNCQYFASLLFEAIARQKNRKLKDDSESD